MYIAWPLLLVALSSSVGNLVVPDRVRSPRWKMGTKLGRSQSHVRLVGRLSRARAVGTHLPSRVDAAETPHLPCLVGQVLFPGATHRAIKRCQKVWRQSWRTAQNLIRLGTKCWVNSLGVKWEQHCRPLWAPVRPASRCRILLVSLLQVNTPLSLVVSKLALIARYLMDSANLVEKAQYERLLHTDTQFAQVGHLGVESMPVISGFYAESSAAVQGTSCVDRAVSQGFDVAMSGSCGKDKSPAQLARSQPGVGTQYAHAGYAGVEFSMPSKPVFFSSGLAVTNEHAVEAVVPGFPAESSAVVQGKSCADSAVSQGFDVAMSGGSCGKDTSPAHLARSQPGVSTQCAHVGYPGVEWVSRATYISRKKRNLETVQRQSKALKKSSTGCETKVRCTR